MAGDTKVRYRLGLTAGLYLALACLAWPAAQYPANWDLLQITVLFAMAWLSESDMVPIPQLNVFLSVSFAVFLAGIMILGPLPTVIVAGSASFAEGLRRHYRPVNLAYNVGQMSLSILITGLVLMWLEALPVNPANLASVGLVFVVAVVTTFVTNTSFVAAFLATRSPAFWSGFRATFSIDFRWSLLSYAITGTLGILMYYVYLTPLGLVGVAVLLFSMIAVRFTARQNAELREAHLETMRILSEVLDARDHYTHGHSTRVAELAKATGAAMGLPEPQQQVIETSALLHDIGKMTIGDDILFKEGALTDEEYARMREHPERGAQMIRPIGFLREVQEIVRYHHERWDGRGYPHGLAGTQIPLGARILSVADAWDAMTIERAYRPAYSHAQAARQLLAGRGTQFDPKIVDVFLKQVLPARGIHVPIPEVTAASRTPALEKGTVR